MEPGPKGKAIGGAARAQALTPERRSEIAKRAVQARLDLGKLPVATHGSPDNPLKIGGIELVCYVLEDGTRLITQEGFLSALGRAKKAKGGHGASTAEEGVDKLPSFLSANNLKPFIPKDLLESTTPLVFRTPSGVKAYGYKAELLPKVCNVYLRARDDDKLLPSQRHLGNAADILIRGLAEVGIIALVDEATGYQKDRSRDALAKILEAFVAKELQPYVKKFPAEFYEEMFRLRGLPFDPSSVKRPPYFGHLTNDIVYRRLAPGVWEELKAKTKKNADGRPAHHMHRLLTQDVGDPRLKELLTKVVTVMQLSTSWQDFKSKLDRIAPPHQGNLSLPLELEGDSGQGL